MLYLLVTARLGVTLTVFIEDSQNHIIADNFVKELYQILLSSLPHFPHKNPVYNKNVRKFIFSKYVHYTVYFEIDEAKNNIVNARSNAFYNIMWFIR